MKVFRHSPCAFALVVVASYCVAKAATPDGGATPSKTAAGTPTGDARSRTSSGSASGHVDFNRDVIPILSGTCFKCHGPDSTNRKSRLRLDVRAAALAPAESGEVAIVPGKPDKSELVRRIFADDPDERMPPKDSDKRLTDAQKQILRQWIAEGAEYKQHWSFVPPKKAALPTVKQTNWPKNPLDYFILARLEAEGLPPSPEADRYTLIRRLSLDLIGLPPTPAEVDAFVRDQSPDAYGKVVDRLLASPHYGERWGRLWLDAARYADSDGFEKDKPRWVWFYRDWVVAALNRDLPYSQFLVEQLAGDLLPNATQDQIVATGYLRNSMINEEGGVDPEQFRMDAIIDRMDAIGKGILGLTIQCAQCHDHKFDPLTQREYYRLFAFLNNDDEANIAVYTADEQQQRADVLRQIAAIDDDLRSRTPDWKQRMAAWEQKAQAGQPEWIVLRPEVDLISTGGQKYLPRPDGSFLAQGYAPTKHSVRLTTKTDVKNIAAFRLELLKDPNLPRGGPGRSIQGTAALTEFAVEAAVAGKTERLKFKKATADFNPPEQPLAAIYDDKSNKHRVIGPISFAIDGKEDTAWATDADPGRRNQPHQAVFTLGKPLASGGTLTIILGQNHGGWNSDDNQNHNLGRFRLSITTTPDAAADPVPAEVRRILSAPRDQRTPVQEAAVFSYWRTTVAEWADANRRIEELWKQYPEGSIQLVLRPRGAARHAHSEARQLPAAGRASRARRAQLSEPVAGRHSAQPPDASPLAHRPSSTDDGPRRREPHLAKLLRYRAGGDFGRPGNAERDAVASGAARLAGPGVHGPRLEPEEAAPADRHQRHLPPIVARDARAARPRSLQPPAGRGPRFRVEAEAVRDIALAASGLLNERVGGPSTHPPLPEFLFAPPVSYGPKTWPVDKGPEQYRRSLYIFRYRSVPHPLLQTFDSPNGDVACVRRSRSDTPLQALMTLNEPEFLDCARALALRTLINGGQSDDDRLVYAFRRCLARQPSAAELATLRTLLAGEQKRFAAPGAKPWELAASDPAKPPKLPPSATPASLAAWTVVSRVLLNLDETITKE